MTISKSNFTTNTVDLNGGAFYYAQAWNTTITQCVFNGNTASSGSAVYMLMSGRQNMYLNVIGSSFGDNTASISGAMYISANTSLFQLNIDTTEW